MFGLSFSSLAAGTRSGYALYSISTPDDFQKLHESEGEDISLVERLFSSSLVTTVSLTAPRKLRVSHFQRGTEICSHSYSNAILAVRLNRLRVIVCLEESLYIHNIRDMKVLHTIRDTPPNAKGLCDFTAADVSYLAYPGSSQVGEVHIFDGANLQSVGMIMAHDSPLAALKFNADGSRIATASEKLKSANTDLGSQWFFSCVTIYSLAFSADAMYLASSSNTETVHVFKLDSHQSTTRHVHSDDEEQSSAGGGVAAAAGWIDYGRRVASAYLPTQVNDILQQDRAYAVAKLPTDGHRSCVALVIMRQKLRLLVASLDGYLYIYNVEPQECSLVKQHRFLQTPTSTVAAAAPSNMPAAGVGSYAKVLSRETTGRSPSSAVAEEHLTSEVAGVRRETENLRLDDSQEFPPMTHSTE